MLKKIILTFLVLILSLILLFGWNMSSFLGCTFFGKVENIKNIKTLKNIKDLKVLTCNIHFGIGILNPRKNLKKRDLLIHLEKLSNILNETKADIVLLQEVDFNSKRTYYLDQALYLAKKANYPYIAKATLFKRKIYPTHQGIGKIDFGMCVLAKIPIETNEITVFSYPPELPFYLKSLYPPHGMQKVTLKHKNLTVINVHLEPYSQKAKESQMAKILKVLKQTPSPLLIGGDFNMTPPSSASKKKHLDDFPWYIKESPQNTKSLMSQIYSLKGFKEVTHYPNEEGTFTFPSDNPTVKIDYLFVRDLKIKESSVIPTDASDHLPLVAKITLQ